MTSESSKSRSLNFSLDELLGVTKTHKEDRPKSGSSNGRPQTRHGRDSISSADSRKESLPSERSTTADSQISTKEEHRDVDDEFLSKLNGMRRRSLVTTRNPHDVRIQQPTPVPEERDEREEREKKEEKEINGNSLNNSMNTRPSSSDSHRTFRLDSETSSKEEKQTTSGKENTNGNRTEKQSKSAPMKGNTAKPPPPVHRPFTSSLTGVKSTAAHERWLQRKLEEEKERKRREKEQKEKKQQAEKEKKEEAKKMFERWKRNFEENLREEKAKERERKAKLEKKKMEEDAMKKKEAENMFEAWKRDRNRSLSAHSRESKERRERQRKREETERAEKRKEAESAFEAWKTAKAEAERSWRERIETREERKKEREMEDAEYKRALADEAYETWLELKEEEQALERSFQGSLDKLEEEVRHKWSMPWMPPSNTVPRTFTPTGRRRKSIDPPRSRAASAGRTRPVNSQIVRRAGSTKSLRFAPSVKG